MTSQQNQSDGSPFDALVGQNIAALRKARGFTQETLATEATRQGVALRQQTIVKIEKGHRPLRLREAEAIARSLGVAVDELLIDDPLHFDVIQRLAMRLSEVEKSALEVEEAGLTMQQALTHLRNELQQLSEAAEIDSEMRALAEAALAEDPAQRARQGADRFREVYRTGGPTDG